MVTTKLGEMQVLCANCDPGMAIKNYDNLICDVCGKIAARVTYGELKILPGRVEPTIPKGWAWGLFNF